MQKLKEWAYSLQENIMVIYYAYKDKRVSNFARILAVCVVAYAFSPIDFIPDFVPILGYLDDLIIVPIGIYIVIRFIPKEVLNDCKEKASGIDRAEVAKNWIAGIIILFIWIFILLNVLGVFLQ